MAVMESTLQRMELLLGNNQLKELKKSCVVLIGIGGVGSYCAEALARSGIGKIILVDHDVISPSNLNRQLHATYETINQEKTLAMKERILSFRDDCEVVTYSQFYAAALNESIFADQIDFAVDAIDTVSSKLDFITACLERGVPFISSLGMANRLKPTALRIGELMQTSYDPLAKVMRSQVRKRGICRPIPVVYSIEQPRKQTKVINEQGKTRKEQMPPASSPFVPAAAGLACASYAIRSILERKEAKTDFSHQHGFENSFQ